MKNIEDYKAKLKQLENEHTERKSALIREYTFNVLAKYKVGDIIKDSVSAIKINRLKYALSFDNPNIVYSGTELKKDLTPRKDGSIREIWGNHNVELLKKCVITTIPQEQWGVHSTHCCVSHGCKYGDKDCPVVTRDVEQKYKCEDCQND